MDQKINRVLLPDIKYSDESGEHTFSYDGGASPLEQAIKAFKTDEENGKSLFLTAMGGQGKTTTLRTLWLDFLRGKIDIPCLYVDCKLLKPEDQDKAIATFIHDKYGFDIFSDNFSSKPIILLDGANETDCLLREKEDDEEYCCFISECKRLLQNKWRLIISSRGNEITGRDQNNFYNESEFSDAEMQFLELSTLTNEQIAIVLHDKKFNVPEESALFSLLKNNMMLSIYLNLKEYGLDIDPDKIKAGKLLDLYFQICVKTRFIKSRVSLSKQYNDSELYKKIRGIEEKPRKKWKSSDWAIYEILKKFLGVFEILCQYSVALAKNLQNEFNILERADGSIRFCIDDKSELNFMEYCEAKNLFESDLDLRAFNHIGIVQFKEEGKLVWVNEIYKEYFEAKCLSELICKALIDFENVYSDMADLLMYFDAIYFGNLYHDPHYFITLQYAGELLDINNDMINTLMSVICNFYESNESSSFLEDCQKSLFLDVVSFIPRWLIVMSALTCNIVPTKCRCIPFGTFGNCTSLTHLNIVKNDYDDTDFRIEWQAFLCCNNLEKINFKRSIKEIGENAFAYCESLEEIYLPKGLKQISNCAFRGCSKLKVIRIPQDTIIFIGSSLDICKARTSQGAITKEDIIDFDVETVMDLMNEPGTIRSLGFIGCNAIIERY